MTAEDAVRIAQAWPGQVVVPRGGLVTPVSAEVADHIHGRDADGGVTFVPLALEYLVSAHPRTERQHGLDTEGAVRIPSGFRSTTNT